MVQRVGRFEIQAEIGRGGFGKVYRAFDPKVGRIVAIKMLDAGGDPNNQIRFRNEARAAGNLQHKNIVTIYEFGEDAGLQYLVMQYLQGEDLQQILKRQTPIPLLQTISIMAEVADGLAFAHQRGVLHRDVKPANIMLLDDGSVKIMDFGIARLTTDYATRLTQMGSLIGSVAYMAPEQFWGDEIDGRCDIWAYGVTFYELLCGRNPFETGNPFSEMHKITQGERPSLDILNCPESLRDIVGRLLQRDRDLRYQSFEEVQFYLEPLLVSMKKQEAARLLDRARELCSDKQWETAQGLIRTALDLDVQNSEARTLWEQVQTELRRVAVRPKIEALAKRADEAAQQRQFSQAIELFDSARKLDSGNIEIEARLSQLRAAKQKSEQAERLISDARRELEGNQLTVAFEKLANTLRFDAEHPEAKQLLNSVQQAMEVREGKLKLEEQMAKASVLIELESFDDAISLLEELARAHPLQDDIRTALDRATAQKQAKDRRERVTAALASARELLKNGKLDHAVQQISELQREFPDSPEAATLLAHAHQQQRARDRADAIESVRKHATGLIEARRYEDALAVVQNAVRENPDEPVLTRLLYTIVSEKQAQEERVRKHIQQQLAAVAECERAQDWNRARSLLAEARALYPDDEALAVAQGRVEKSREQFERQREIAAEVKAVRRLLAPGDWPAALSRIQSGQARYGEDPAFQDLADEAQQTRSAERNTLLGRIGNLIASNDFERADAELLAARTRFPEDPDLSSLGRTRIQAERSILERRQAEEARAEGERLRAEHARAEAERLREQQHAEQLRQGQLREKELREQKHKAALDSLLAQIENYLSAGLAEQALAAAASGRIEFGSDPRLLAAEEAARKLRVRNAALQQAQTESRLQNWRGAATTLETLLQQNPNDKEARQKLEAIVAQERRERRDKGRRESEALLQNGQLAEAVKCLGDLQLEFPDDALISEDLHRATEAWKQRQRRDACTQGRQRADAAIRAGDFAGAINILRGLLQQFPDEAMVLADLKEAETGQQRQVRREHYAAERRRAAGLMQNRNFDAAVAVLQALSQEFPADAVLREELDAAVAARDLQGQREALKREAAELERSDVRRNLRDKSRAEAEQLMQSGRFEDAVESLRALQVLFPGDVVIQEDLKRAVDAVSERSRRGTYLQGRQRALEARRSGEFDTAVHALKDLLQQFPGDLTLKEDLQEAASAHQEQMRRERYSEERRRAAAFVQDRNFDAAVSVLEALLKEFPSDAVLEEDLKSAVGARDLQNQREQLDREVAKLQKLYKKGDAAAVFDMGSRLGPELQDSRVRELMDWAQTEIRRSEQKGELESAETLRRKRTLRFAAGGALVVVAAVVGAVLLRKPPPPPPGPVILSADRAELDFAVSGGAAPAPAVLTLNANQPGTHWTVSPTADWLIVQPREGSTPSQVKVSVDPAHLGEAAASAELIFTSEDRSGSFAATVRAHPVRAEVSLSVDRTAIGFEFSPGATPPPQTILLSGSASKIKWAASPLPPWLKAEPSRGVTGPTPTTVRVSVDPSRMSTASASAALIFSTDNHSSASPPILVTAGQVAANVSLSVSPAHLEFTFVSGGPKSSQEVSLSGTPAGTHWALSGIPDWLSADRTQGNLSAGATQIRLTADPGRLSQPSTVALLTFTVDNGPTRPIQVTARVEPKPPTTLSVNPRELSFIFDPGQGASTEPLAVNVSPPGARWSVDSKAEWMSVSMNGASAVQVSVDPRRLSTSQNTGELVFKTENGEFSLAVKVTAIKLVDCNSNSYSRAKSGTLSWQRAAGLPPNAPITIGGSDQDLQGGTLQPRRVDFPGCKIVVASPDPNIVFDQEPSRQDGFSRFKFHSVSPNPVFRITLNWKAE